MVTQQPPKRQRTAETAETLLRHLPSQWEHLDLDATVCAEEKEQIGAKHAELCVKLDQTDQELREVREEHTKYHIQLDAWPFMLKIAEKLKKSEPFCNNFWELHPWYAERYAEQKQRASRPLVGNATLAALEEAQDQLDNLDRQLKEEKRAFALTKLRHEKKRLKLIEELNKCFGLFYLMKQPYGCDTLGWYIKHLGEENVRCDAYTVKRPPCPTYKVRIHYNDTIEELTLIGPLETLNGFNMEAGRVRGWYRAKIDTKFEVKD